MPVAQTLGLIGSGMLGGAMARGMLRSGVVAPERLRIANRSGRLSGFDAWPQVTIATDAVALVPSCDVILLALPPAATVALTLPAANSLILSVMAGVSLARLQEITGSTRVVRGMSNPAAEKGLAYSPWVAADTVSAEDKALARALFGGCGLTDEVPNEDQIDRFTALTGPVPGFVAFFAESMAAHARQHGVAPETADRAIRQLFRASGELMAEGDATPADHVDEMIAYAGTTAAGLEAMQRSPLALAVSAGLDAAYEKAKRIAGEC